MNETHQYNAESLDEKTVDPDPLISFSVGWMKQALPASPARRDDAGDCDDRRKTFGADGAT